MFNTFNSNAANDINLNYKTRKTNYLVLSKLKLLTRFGLNNLQIIP